MKKITAFITLCLTLLALTSCQRFEVEKGMRFFGHIPSMNLGIQTNDVRFSPDDVRLDVYYGWGENFVSDATLGYETVGVVLFAYSGRLLCSQLLSVELDDYTDLDAVSPDTYHILKIITSDLDDPKYICRVSKYGKAAYGTHEVLHIPSEVFKNESVGFEIAIGLVLKKIESEKYVYYYTERMHLDFKISENKDIVLVEY